MTPINAKMGDVFFTHTDSWLGRAIRWAETDPNEINGTWTNHTGVVVEDGEIGGSNSAVVVEALWHVRKGPLEELNGKKVRVFRPNVTWDWQKRVDFRTAAGAYVGQRYGWWKLGGHLIDRAIFRGKKVISSLFFIDKRPICSYLAAHVYDKVGIRFGMDPDAADPDEMMDYCLAHPEEWQEVV